MSLATLLLLALGVSADAFAVAVGRGLARPHRDQREAVSLAVVFGGFQALMPLLGLALGATLLDVVERWDHWVAAALLVAVGGRMVQEGLTPEDDEAPQRARLTLRALLLLGIATSIDALAVGVTFAAVEVDVVRAVTTIGVTTAALTYAGVVLGRRLGARMRGPAELAGGLVLIAIAVRVLVAPGGALS